MSTAIEVRHLKKYFPVPKGLLHAVDDINFTIEDGETLGVVGESGCGKSTLGRLIMNLLDSTDGQVLYEGQDITNLRGRKLFELRSKIQMIFQDPYSSIDPRMSVSNIIEEPLITCGIEKSKAKRTEKVEELMDIVGLARRFATSYPHELDGGRRQRVGIARALAVNPRFIVCDEPVSALDVSIQAQILNLLQDLQRDRGLTYMFITHNLSVVKHISSNIMVMYLGQMVEKAPTKELFKNPLHPYTKALLSAIPVPTPGYQRERILLKGELTSPVNPGAGCRFAKRCIYATEECFNRSPELKDLGEGHFVACHKVESK